MKFDLVIPCYNPAVGWEYQLVTRIRTLQKLLPDVFKKLSKIIVVNDGSIRQDNTFSQAVFKHSGFDFTLINYPENRGKGHAVREGARHATAPLCMYTDLDIPFGIESIQALLRNLEAGADIVLGARSKSAYYHAAPIARKLISAGLMVINKYILTLPVDDTQAGIKGFNHYGKAILLQTRTDRFLFDLEFIRLAMAYRDLDMVSVPVKNALTLQLSPFSWKVLIQESLNFFIILWTTGYVFRTKKHLAWHRLRGV